MKRFAIALMAGVLAAMTSLAGEIAWRVPTYSLVARQMPVREALDTFATAEGVSLVMSDAVGGVFSGDFRELPAGEFLDRVATLHNLTWYYDGAAVYVYAAGEILSTLTDLAYMKAADVMKLLKELGVEDSRFPIKTASEGEIIMVSGPPRYVQLVLQTIAKADRLKQMRTFNEVDTRLFPLKHTWADNASLNIAGSESALQIRGVAYLLQEIMGAQQTRTRDAGTNEVESAEDKILAARGQVNPIIRPENRLNAVLVRDSVTRMPMYEKLIAQLDRPQKLVEIQVTTLEMTRENALDWQASLKLAATDRSYSHGAAAGGLNAGNLITPATIAGMGAQAAASYIDKHVDLQASLSALRVKGKARNISRTSLLTLNNMAAEISDTQSYTAKCIGQEVATVQEITAGTRLGICPRLVMAASTNEPNQVWLTLQLQDGGFDSVAVEGLPMKRTSMLETQAAVYEGDSILLGGNFRDIDEEAGWGIPILRDIPFIGWIFGGSSVRRTTVQRLFILTPHAVELGHEAVVREQAAHLRDIRLEEVLSRDSKIDSEVRVERELRQHERDEIRLEKHQDRVEQLKKEIDFRKDQRDWERDKARSAHEANLEARREKWESEKKGAEKK